MRPHPASRCLLMAVLSLLAACSGEGVTLEGDALRLSYDCARFTPRAATAEERALLRGYAVNAVRDAKNHDRLPAVDSIIRAYDAGDDLRLERAVVRYVCRHGDVREAARRVFPESGSTPPDLVLTPYSAADAAGAAGARFRLSDHRGKLVVLSFWATWCAPCLKELPELHRIAERHRDEGVLVYGIVHRDRPEDAQKWLREHGYDIPLLVDADREIARAYEVQGVPNTYVIGRDGRVARRGLGYGGPGRLERTVAELLNAPAAGD